MKFLSLAIVLSLTMGYALANETTKAKVMHDKEHHHTGMADHEHDEAHHKAHDHKAHHPEHDATKAVGEDEHSEKKK